MIEYAIQTTLLHSDSITSIVGNRIYLFDLPQPPTFPAITQNVISRKHGHNLDGGNGYATARIQIDCWGNDYNDCISLAEALRLLLDGFQGDLQNVRVGSMEHDDENDFYEQPRSGSQFGLFHIACDYMVSYFEPSSPIKAIGGISLGGTYF